MYSRFVVVLESLITTRLAMMHPQCCASQVHHNTKLAPCRRISIQFSGDGLFCAIHVSVRLGLVPVLLMDGGVHVLIVLCALISITSIGCTGPACYRSNQVIENMEEMVDKYINHSPNNHETAIIRVKENIHTKRPSMYGSWWEMPPDYIITFGVLSMHAWPIIVGKCAWVNIVLQHCPNNLNCYHP